VTCDGHVVTWGGRHGFGRGGNSLAVQRQLVDVQRLSATDGAFAALLGDGRVPLKPMIPVFFFVFVSKKAFDSRKNEGNKNGLYKEVGGCLRSCFFSFFVGEESKKDFRRVPRQEEGDPETSRSRIPKSHDLDFSFPGCRLVASLKV